MDTKRAKIMEKLIAAGTAGCEKEDLSKVLSISKGAVYNHIHALRKKHSIRTDGSKYILGSVKTKVPEKTTDVREVPASNKSPDVLRYLSEHPNGVLTNDLCGVFRITKSALFSRLHLLRCKGNKILLKEGKYILKELAGAKEHGNPTQDDSNLKSLLGSINMKDLNALEPTERSDCLDMLKKSLFYRKSAEAMIQTSKIIRNITEN